MSRRPLSDARRQVRMLSHELVPPAVMRGNPPVSIGSDGLRGRLFAVMVTLRSGEERIVAERLREAPSGSGAR